MIISMLRTEIQQAGNTLKKIKIYIQKFLLSIWYNVGGMFKREPIITRGRATKQPAVSSIFEVH